MVDRVLPRSQASVSGRAARVPMAFRLSLTFCTINQSPDNLSRCHRATGSGQAISPDRAGTDSFGAEGTEMSRKSNVNVIPITEAKADPITLIGTVLDTLYLPTEDRPRPPYRSLESAQDALRCALVRSGVSSQDAHAVALAPAAHVEAVTPIVLALLKPGAPASQRVYLAEGRVQDRAARMGIPLATVHAEGAILARAMDAERKALSALRATFVGSGPRSFK